MTVGDNDYLKLLKENDPAAWQYIIRIYLPVLSRYAKRILNDDAAAEDVVMDIFVKLWQQNADFADMQQVKKYLYTATRNNCLNILRSKQREKKRHETFAKASMQADDFFENEILYSELLAEIRKEIDSLSPRMREIFILAYFSKKTNEEISAQLNLSNQTVRNQKTAALALIRKALKPKFLLPLLLLFFSLKNFS